MGYSWEYELFRSKDTIFSDRYTCNRNSKVQRDLKFPMFSIDSLKSSDGSSWLTDHRQRKQLLERLIEIRQLEYPKESKKISNFTNAIYICKCQYRNIDRFDNLTKNSTNSTNAIYIWHLNNLKSFANFIHLGWRNIASIHLTAWLKILQTQFTFVTPIIWNLSQTLHLERRWRNRQSKIPEN